uniref:Variable lymphocyte receptor A cassette n=1 Tax=Petromyzon marinus TaxID=7757 RepID=S4S1B6_PETMA
MASGAFHRLANLKQLRLQSQ